MRKSLLSLTLLAGVSFGCFATAQAAPQIGAAMLDEPAANALLQDVAVEVHVFHGRPFCFYFDGWHGAGWYRCGWAWRRGLGWGGVYGWNDWEYGPAARRFGHVGGRFRSGERGYSRGEIGVGTTGQGGMRMHDRGAGAAIEGGRGGRDRIGTTGQGGMRTNSGGSMQGGPSGGGGAAARGGPSVGSSPGGGTGAGAGGSSPGAAGGGPGSREH